MYVQRKESFLSCICLSQRNPFSSQKRCVFCPNMLFIYFGCHVLSPYPFTIQDGIWWDPFLQNLLRVWEVIGWRTDWAGCQGAGQRGHESLGRAPPGCASFGGWSHSPGWRGRAIRLKKLSEKAATGKNVKQTYVRFWFNYIVDIYVYIYIHINI